MANLNILMLCLNNREKTQITVESVISKVEGDFKFIILNNGSTDDTKEYLNSLTNEKIYVVHSEKNLGVAIGRNTAMQHLDDDCEFIMIIDNDIVATDKFANKLLDFMKKHPDIGICGPCTNFAGTPQQIKTPSLESIEDIHQFAASYRSPNEFSYVPHKWTVIGFCMLVRRGLINQLGNFDENFKLYGCEDNDLCYRAQKAGWRLAYVMSVYVHHWGHGGLSQLGEEGTEQWAENREYFKRKNGFL